jgi:hypothetical protein
MIYNQIALAYTAAIRIIIPPRQQLSSSPLLSLSFGVLLFRNGQRIQIFFFSKSSIDPQSYRRLTAGVNCGFLAATEPAPLSCFLVFFLSSLDEIQISQAHLFPSFIREISTNCHSPDEMIF